MSEAAVTTRRQAQKSQSILRFGEQQGDWSGGLPGAWSSRMTWVGWSGGTEGHGQGGLKAAQGGWESAYGPQCYSGDEPGKNNLGGKFNREGA